MPRTKKETERIDDSKLQDIMSKIEGKYGKGSVMTLTDRAKEPVLTIPTGSLIFNLLTGIGGVPRGKIIEFSGENQAGKTTDALQIIAEAQKMGLTFLYIDMEHALNPEYAAKLGVNLDTLLISQPSSGNEAFNIAQTACDSGQVDGIVFDSIAAAVPQQEIDGESGDSLPGLQARLVGQACRKLAPSVSKNNVCFIAINQLRATIGGYGPTTITPGGKALKFYASMRVEFTRIGALKVGEEIIGNKTKIKIVKNKFSSPFKEAEIELIYGEGFSKESDLITLASDNNIIQKSGAWYAYNGEKIGQGKEQTRQYLKSNPDIFNEIRQKVLETFQS